MSARHTQNDSASRCPVCERRLPDCPDGSETCDCRLRADEIQTEADAEEIRHEEATARRGHRCSRPSVGHAYTLEGGCSACRAIDR